MKSVHQLHDSQTLPWKTLFLTKHDWDFRASSRDSYIAAIIREEPQCYWSIMASRVGDGATTSFWHNNWLLGATLGDTFASLYSHLIRQDISVFDALHAPAFSDQLCPRMSTCAREELQILRDCLHSVTLSDEPDVHCLAGDGCHSLSSKGACLTL